LSEEEGRRSDLDKRCEGAKRTMREDKTMVKDIQVSYTNEDGEKSWCSWLRQASIERKLDEAIEEMCEMSYPLSINGYLPSQLIWIHTSILTGKSNVD
jgi:hypothetical protein